MLLSRLKTIFVRLKRLWILSIEYDRQVKTCCKAIQLCHERIGDHTTVHGDIHQRELSVIIAIGKYRKHDYVRIFTVDATSFPDLVDTLKQLEPRGKVGFFDMPGRMPFRYIYKGDRF